MSKRFGRNQKRKLADRLARVEKERDNYKEHYHGAKNNAAYQLQEKDRIIKNTAEVLGRNFATLTPNEVNVRDLKGLQDSWATYCEHNVKHMDKDRSLQDILETVFLPILKFASNIDSITKIQHIRFTYHGKTVAYAISEDAFYVMPREQITWQIAEQMARIMFEQMVPRK